MLVLKKQWKHSKKILVYKKQKLCLKILSFIKRGNVIDLAVAVIIGGAFRNIINSFVGDVLMPIIGKLLGNTNITALKWVLEPAQRKAAEIAVYYGMFLQNVLDFVVIAFFIFIVLRMLEKLKKKELEKEVVESTPEDIETVTRNS
jgi:large conductance mechanosensitive channel